MFKCSQLSARGAEVEALKVFHVQVIQSGNGGQRRKVPAQVPLPNKRAFWFLAVVGVRIDICPAIGRLGLCFVNVLVTGETFELILYR